MVFDAGVALYRADLQEVRRCHAEATRHFEQMCMRLQDFPLVHMLLFQSMQILASGIARPLFHGHADRLWPVSLQIEHLVVFHLSLPVVEEGVSFFAAALASTIKPVPQ